MIRKTNPIEMSKKDRFAMSVYMPLNDPRAGTIGACVYRELHRTQWCDPQAMGRIQEKKVKALLDHAIRTVPFFANHPPWVGGEPETLRERLATYPILTKDAIRANSSNMHPQKGLPRSFTRATTGGTTGKPLEIWYGKRRRAMVLAASWRGRSWLGIKPWTRGANVQAFGKGSWYGRLRMRLTNKWLFDVFGKNTEERAVIAATLSRIRPKYLEGFVSDTLALGEACHAAGVKIARVLTTGEMLYEHQRNKLEELFGAKVSDYYGCNEVGAMAFECEMGNKHVTDEHVILEVVDDAGTPVWEKAGRILLTDLDNWLTPLVRYEVGDVGILTRSRCPCGRGLTVLSALEGRTQDAIMNEQGDSLSTLFLAGKFKDLKAIHSVQFVQRSLTQIDLLYEGATPDLYEELREMQDEIRDRLGPQMEVRSRCVSQLRYTNRGKRRLVIQLGEGETAAEPSLANEAAGDAGK